MKTRYLVPIIFLIFIGCGFFKQKNIYDSNKLIDSIEIENNKICLNESVKISVNSRSKDVIYKIGEHTGNPAILKFNTPGKKKVHITLNDVMNSKVEYETITIEVNDCKKEGIISITANPEDSNMSIMNFKVNTKPDQIKEYKWNFGDGTIETSSRNFIQHDYRTRIQKDFFSTFIVQITALGINGSEYTGMTSISIPNTHYLSKKMGTPTIPTKYNRFPVVKHENLIIDLEINNIFEETFSMDVVSIDYKNHITETPIKQLTYNVEKIFDSNEVPGNQTYHSTITLPLSDIPENATRISINIQGKLNHEQKTFAKAFLDIPPKNDEIVHSQNFEEVKNQVLIRKLEQAEKFYGKGRPITTREINAMEGNHE